ncbi:hypothetical protein [Natrarchaeobaculum aegyptiacum]|uniref:hypothetical protein n=1 Tax=Natrarchaeobaculum aegyptiacum TaxID=745377 RepID=UPI001E5C2773|nr:hypothetical protein [Natrarchaeobaculum aegyptiacum]
MYVPPRRTVARDRTGCDSRTSRRRAVVRRDPARGEQPADGGRTLEKAQFFVATVDALYLLTTTAVDFFAARGYDEIDRADAPDAIRNTTEFADLCPSSATCMRRSR